LVEGIGEHYGAEATDSVAAVARLARPRRRRRTLAMYDYADGLDKLPDAKRQPNRLLVALGDDDAVETAHHLCRPGVATKAFLGHATADPYVEVWTCDRWEPWSVVTATI
jgi:hypothetical protein